MLLNSCSEDCEVCTQMIQITYENLDTIPQSDFIEIFPTSNDSLSIELCGDDLEDLKGQTVTTSSELNRVGIKLREVTQITYTCNE